MVCNETRDVGVGPDNRPFSYRLSSSNDERFPNSNGIDPDSRVWNTWKSCRGDSIPISEGIFPVRTFAPSTTPSKFVSSPISLGTVPVKVAASVQRSCRFWRFPFSLGNSFLFLDIAPMAAARSANYFPNSSTRGLRGVLRSSESVLSMRLSTSPPHKRTGKGIGGNDQAFEATQKAELCWERACKKVITQVDAGKQ